MPDPRRHLRPPPGRRAYKVPAGPASLPLLYLGWGRRRFGVEPVPLGLNLGWVYAVVTGGTPVLLAGDQRIPCRPGDAFIFDRECPMGWDDAPAAGSSVLVWIWREAPTIGAMVPAAGGWEHWSMPPEQLEGLHERHRECRRELAAPDGWTGQALVGCRRGVDVAWMRAAAGTGRRDGSAAARYEAGLNWMRHNLSARHPVAELAIYLGVSEATLQRLFKHHGGRGPLAEFQALKAREARRLLDEGRQVKEVAWLLGFRYANDFSRFFKKCMGRAPTR